MIKIIDKIVSKTPIAISGLLLAILSLGNLYDNSTVKLIAFTIGLIIILILINKLIFKTTKVKEELNQLVVLSTSGTFSMALMVFSTYILNLNYYLALIIWILAIILHASLIIIFTYKYIIKNFNIEEVYGSYWVVYVGITMASITGILFNLQNITRIFFVFGFTVMIPTFLLVTYRYLNYPVKLEQNKPLICIYAALFNILIVGYVNSFSNINQYFVLILYAIATLCFIFSLYKFLTLIKIPFYPSYSAFTFPFVITAIASTKILSLYNNSIVTYMALTETIIATILVCYVLIKYLQSYLTL